MARKRDWSPEEQARREKIRELLQLANVGSMDDIHERFKETIRELIENRLEAELDGELGYGKYDYRNKTTDNSRNGHSSKKLKTSYGEIETSRDPKGDFEPQLIQKKQTSVSQAIAAAYPKTNILNCIVHQLRNSSKYVSYKDLKELMADLKRVYAAVDGPSTLDALEDFAGKWDKKYPKISKSRGEKWGNLSTYFKFPEEVRRLIYTTNAIEGFNRQLQKVTKSKSVFPTDDILLKMLYLMMIDITAKWTGRRQDWARIHAQLNIFYGDRLLD